MAKNISTIIEITDVHVKVFQSQFLRGRHVICGCEIKAIKNSTDEEVISALNAALFSKKINPEDLTLVIPRQFVILKQLKLPSHNEAEIKKMVGLQLVNQIPYPIDDVIYDYFLLDKDQGGYVQVLVIIIHREVCDRYLKVVHRVGFSPTKLTLSSLGLLEWFNYQETHKGTSFKQPTILINLDLNHSEIIFCHNKKMFFSRNINYGTKDLTDDQALTFISQIQLSLKTYAKDNMGPEMKNIVLLSGLAQMDLLKEKIEKEFQIPVDAADALENVLCQKNLNLSSLKNQGGVSLTVGLGLAICDPKKTINLIPPEVKQNKISKHHRVQLVKFIFLLICTIFLGISLLGLELYQKIALLNKIEDKIQQLKPQFVRAEIKIKLVDALNKELQERIFTPDLIVNLYQLVPAEVTLRSLSLDENGLFTIQGYSTKNSSVNLFQSNLVRSTVFKEVNLQFSTQRKIFNIDVTDFQITTRLKVKEEQK